MKSKTLRILLFALLGIVIVCAVSLPTILSVFGEKKLLGSVGKVEDNLVSSAEPPDVRTRLSLISDHSTGARAVTLTEQKNIITSGGDNAVLSAAVAELEKLSNAGLLPALSSEAPTQNLTCTAATYSDPENIASRVTIWKLEFSADGHDVSIWMDAETHLVFCVSFTSPEFGLSTAIAESLSAAWGNYVGLGAGSVSITGESFSSDFSGISFDFLGSGDMLCIRLSESEFKNS